MHKNENRLCPLPYEEVLEDIITIVWTEQCGYLEELRYLAGADLTLKKLMQILSQIEKLVAKFSGQ